MTSLQVLDCGPSVTIQDNGRPGWSRLGIPDAGAMDPRLLRIANTLVGNDPDEAALEFAFMGGTFRARGGDLRLAVCGACTSLSIDSKRLRPFTSFELYEGETLTIGRAQSSVYMMMAIEGGIDFDASLGSLSSDARAGIGAFNGRTLTPGDVIPLRKQASRWSFERAADPLQDDHNLPIHVVLGPQAEAITERSMQALLSEPFYVTPQINRMAYRLDGPDLERVQSWDKMISDGTLPGSIQLPGDGRPLVMMADRQTIGGYPKVATIISADLPRFAQRPPGQHIQFAAITPEDARQQALSSRIDLETLTRPVRRTNWSPKHFAFDYIADGVVDALREHAWG